MSGNSYDRFETDAELLYNHLRTVCQTESPSQLLDRYRRLFIDGIAYPQAEIQATVYRLVNSCWAASQFDWILNRCCYIFINRWSHLPNGAEATENLIRLFRETPPANETDPVQRLHDLVEQFVRSNQHEALSRRVWAARDLRQTRQNRRRLTTGELLNHFPLLFPYCLLEYDSSEGGRETVRKQQKQREWEIEERLWRYARRHLAAKGRSSAPVENPMLLNSSEVADSVRQFTYQAVGSLSYHAAARQLVQRSQQAANHRAFKEQLYLELTTFVSLAFRLRNPTSKHDYGNQSFNRWLKQQLIDTLPQYDELPPHDSLRVQTCRHLLDVLLEPPRDRSDHHFRFVNLTENLGAMFTAGLLLKIILVCHNGDLPLTADGTNDRNVEAIRSHLAERFAVLFRQYETTVCEGVNWLVDCLENWMIAASIQFGKYGISCWVSLLKAGG